MLYTALEFEILGISYLIIKVNSSGPINRKFSKEIRT